MGEEQEAAIMLFFHPCYMVSSLSSLEVEEVAKCKAKEENENPN